MNIQTLKEAVKWANENKLFFYSPYDFQQEFMNAGKDHLQRAFCAGNRLGKTHTGAYEMACHLTGLYPEWWNGYRCEGSGHQFAVIGISQASARKILQDKLFGTNDCRDLKAMGTGMLPKDRIVFEPMEKDGPRIVSAQIKHVDGGTNTVFFFGASQEKDIMGMTLKGVWIDETDKTQCGPLYDQCNTRVMTTNGFLFQTFTPENGIDVVVKKFMDAQEDPESDLYLKMASMYDAHINRGGHITDAMIKRIKDGSPEFMWDCRINGIPSAGVGMVFTVKDSEIEEEPIIRIPDHWTIVHGVDFGEVVDPSVIVTVAYDPDTNVDHLIKETYLNEDRSPRAIAAAILGGEFPNGIVVVPHDGGLHSDDPQAKGKLLIEYGCNVHRDTFTNPADVRLGIETVTGRNTHNSIKAGLIEMVRRFEEGSLKVNREMTEWFKEKRTYFFKSSPNGGYKPSGADHVIDASRYALMSRIGHIGSTAYEARKNPNEDNSWKDFQPRLSY